MSSKFNVLKIIVDHWSTLRDHSTNRISYSDAGLQILIPLLISLVFYLVAEIEPETGNRIDSSIIAAFAIFTALLFNLQIMIMGMMRPEEPPIETKSENDQLKARSMIMRKTFIKEIFYNVSYAILIAITLVAISIFIIFFNASGSKILKTLEVFLVCHFLLVSFMVLKRTHSLFAVYPND
jgi:hypothetical protein